MSKNLLNNKNITTQMKVYIDPVVHAKIMYWVKNCDIECSGLGKVIKLGNGVFYVTSAMLLKQEGDAVTTTIDAGAVGKAMFETKDDDGDLNWWWHSHVDMQVFWSRTDEDTIDELSDKGYCLATVFNRKGQTRSAYKHKNHELLPDFMMDDIPTYVALNPSKEQEEAWKKELDEKVDRRIYQFGGFRTGYYGARRTNSFTSEEFKYREYCTEKKEMVWVWNLPYANPKHMFKKQVVKQLGYDPTKSGKKGKPSTSKHAAKTGTVVAKGKPSDNMPRGFSLSKIIPKDGVGIVYNDYVTYFKHNPTLPELEQFYQLNVEDYIEEFWDRGIIIDAMGVEVEAKRVGV